MRADSDFAVPSAAPVGLGAPSVLPRAAKACHEERRRRMELHPRARVQILRGLRVTRMTGIATLLASATACDWFTDFKDQPKMEPWEKEAMVGDTAKIGARGQPEFSVPIGGTAVAAFQVSYMPMPATVDSMSPLQNPVAPTDSSLATGQRYYQINCAVCHGDRGMGDGPVTRYGMPGISIVTDMTKNRTDGYIWGMIRNGRGLMPSYNRIEERERWDVVNYVRALQGRLATAARTGPMGYPGQTGTALPGATGTAPTRPVPYASPASATATPAPAAADAPTGAKAAPADTMARRGVTP